jgi:hypothetical protein
LLSRAIPSYLLPTISRRYAEMRNEGPSQA